MLNPFEQFTDVASNYCFLGDERRAGPFGQSALQVLDTGAGEAFDTNIFQNGPRQLCVAPDRREKQHAQPRGRISRLLHDALV